VEVVMPKWGMTMQEAVLSSWIVAVGDVVTEGQPLAVVETEKVDADVESPGAGVVVELIGAPGETIAVGTVIARIE
jgi:pyruvate/2-oxoglutarate dehydrogenase complex dihydrolipoamide acyltransferase (E2) component